jgi:P-type conjugative transfer protein TrbJ
MRRRRFLTASSFFTVAALTALKPPKAQLTVICPSCSSLVDQVVANAKQVLQYVTQLQQYATQLQQYANMITNTISLPSQIFSSVQADIGQVRSLINAASLLTGQSGSILTRLQTAGAYANQAFYLPTNIGAQFTMWQTTIANANTTLGQALGVQQSQLSNYASLQAGIQSQSAAAQGQKQAIQATTSAIALVSTQLNQVQATLTATAQSTATRDDIAADRQAAEDSQYQLFIQGADLPLTGYPRY